MANAPLLVLMCGFGVSVAITALFLKRAVSIGLLDRPSSRSSHVQATPTAGGVGIVAASLLVAALVWMIRGLDSDWMLATALATLLALIGFLDDRKGLSARTRFLCQLVIALVYASHVLLPWYAWPTLIVGFVLVGLTNFFNFMDGIDGLAGGQAVFIAGAGALIGWFGGAATDSVLMLAGIAAAAAGFLVFNWSPARIFMGDTGSLFLGFLLSAAALLGVLRAEIPVAVWLILWAPFLVDCTFTLVHRAMRGERLYVAHREHAYQRLAVVPGSSHRRVTGLFLIVDIVWLLPLALVAQARPESAPWIVSLAFAPIAVAVLGVQWRAEIP